MQVKKRYFEYDASFQYSMYLSYNNSRDWMYENVKLILWNFSIFKNIKTFQFLI